MKEKKLIKLSSWQKVSHYSIVGFLFAIPCFNLFYLIKHYYTNLSATERHPEEMILISLPFLILGIIFIFIQSARLKFKEIKITNTIDDFQEAIRRTADEYDWRIEFVDDNFLRAYHHDFWAKSTGEMITIIRQDDKIFINSICDPDYGNSQLSFGWNKKNVRIFLIHLYNTVDKLPYVTKVEKEKNEGPFKWKFTDILQRVFIYGLSLFFLVISFCNLNSNGVIITRLFALIIAGTYFYFVDYKLIKILRKKE